MEYDNCAIRKVKHERKDGTEVDGFAIYLFKDGVIKQDLFSKDLTIHNPYQNDETDELCEIGQKLWDNFRDDCDKNYKKYVEHIKDCEVCKKGFEIDEIIDKKGSEKNV